MRRLLIVVLAAGACNRDPDAWPVRGKADLDAFCSGFFGQARVCPCFASKATLRVPWPRGKALLAGADAGVADVYNAFEQITRECAKDLPRDPWPRRVRDAFMSGCRRDPSATQTMCDCLADLVQKKMNAETYMAAGMSIHAGDGLPPSMKELFQSEDAIGCFEVAANAPWPAGSLDKIVAQCRENPDLPSELCPCIGAEMQRDITFHELALVASERPGAADVQSKIERLGPGWLKRCSPPTKPKK